MSNYCGSCQATIAEKPKEVLFGIHINENDEVYFSMTDKNWFNKVFQGNSFGITIDIVSKERYNCAKNISDKSTIPKGVLLPAVYKENLVKNAVELIEGGIFTKIGKIPSSLSGKELEGNLVILNGPNICYYTNFVNIDRSIWSLLPMGFFVDSLLNEYSGSETDQSGFFTYTQKKQFEIPFSKGSSSFDPNYLMRYFDSIDLSSSQIKKVEIRAYSSIEGTEKINKALMSKRAETVVSALKKYQPSLGRINIVTAENWLEFFNDIKETDFSELEDYSKQEIKQELTDPDFSADMESILAAHRKVVAILYLDKKTNFASNSDLSLSTDFKNAIDSKNIAKAQVIQKEIVNRIIDKQLPIEFLDKIEVPKSRAYSPILNDREVYKHLLKATDEYQAFENFLEIRKIDPDNGRLNYNICVLRFFMWQYAKDTLSSAVLLSEIDRLFQQGISLPLIKRMHINYYILKSEDQMLALDYRGKDSSLSAIKNIFKEIEISDEDIYSLSKYYSFYSHQDWAQEIIAPRIGSVDVSEDLIFYYLNLLFFKPVFYGTDEFLKASLNAINLNTKRFCRFFLPNDRGGASMQLLEYEEIKKLYCAECN